MTTTKKMARYGLNASAASIALGVLFAAVPAQAQSPAASNTTEADDNQTIVVTGSLFRRTTTETASPVTVLSAQTLERAGVTNINDAIRSVSADGAGSISTGFQGGFSAGGAAVSLRGLGVSSTLVLIDGLRSANFPLNDDGHNAYVDLNSIPIGAVETVQVLKDGAAANYGADAIGGVVNIVMKKSYNGIGGRIEGGASTRGYAGRLRGQLAAGFGDYDANGLNFYVTGEYQRDSALAGNRVGFPFDTTDLSSIGGLDNNTADSSLQTATVNAVVRLAGQSDLNNPFTGGAVPTGTYTTLNLTNCTNGTFTVAGAAGGTACRHNTAREFSQIQPRQERIGGTARLSFRLGDTIEGYATATYYRNTVDIKGTPRGIRQQQPYGGSPALSSTAPGVVLPVYVCAAGLNCATAADRRLNPNNPYAAAFAANPAAGAARIYYLFGDIPFGTHRVNEMYRATAGLNGEFAEGWNWRVDGAAAKDKLEVTQYGTIDIAGLKNVINTGSYNFVNPELNTQAVRDTVAPTYKVPSHSTLLSLDASVTGELAQLPGGPLQLAVGGQIRRETLENNTSNPGLTKFANTSAAFGKHTVTAAFFEIDAPVTEQILINGAGRYDHYSEGFSAFSPKVMVKYTPVKEIALRGTFSKGFRAPTFAESNPRSSYAGFVTITPPTSFQLAHGGLITAGNTNPYAQAYSLGSGSTGNPNLKPEKSRSFTFGAVVEPVRGISFTLDYYDIKKTDVIVTGPDAGTARAAYFAGTALPAGYTVAAVDGIDPLFPTALPRVLVISVPYVNAASQKTSGFDFTATATLPITDDVKFTSRLDMTMIRKFNVNLGDGVVRKYVGTLGPYELSSGAGTPKWRGNWQNTLEFGNFSLTATTYYVSKIKQVGADEEAPDAQGNIDLSCASANLYGTGNNFCYIKRFIYADLNAQLKVNDGLTFNILVGNFTNEKAPLATASYSGVNYLPTWHYAGVIGRTFRAGATFKL